MRSETELLLSAASRSQLVRQKIQLVLEGGHWLVCDRFCDSTRVCQGAARHLDAPSDPKAECHYFTVNNSFPDPIFILDVDRATAQSRLQTEIWNLLDRPFPELEKDQTSTAKLQNS